MQATRSSYAWLAGDCAVSGCLLWCRAARRALAGKIECAAGPSADGGACTAVGPGIVHLGKRDAPALTCHLGRGRRRLPLHARRGAYAQAVYDVASDFQKKDISQEHAINLTQIVADNICNMLSLETSFNVLDFLREEQKDKKD